MGRGAFEIQTVPRFQPIVFRAVEPDLEFSAEDVQKFFPFVSVGFATATVRLHAEEMGLHRGVPPGEQLHANTGSGLQDFPLAGTHEMRIFSRSLEKRQDIRTVEARDAAKSGDRGTHLAALDGAEESDGDTRGFGDLCEGKPAARAETAKTLPRKSRGFRRRRYDALPLQNVNDGGGIQAASATEKERTLEQADVAVSVEAVAAPRGPGEGH